MKINKSVAYPRSGLYILSLGLLVSSSTFVYAATNKEPILTLYSSPTMYELHQAPKFYKKARVNVRYRKSSRVRAERNNNYAAINTNYDIQPIPSILRSARATGNNAKPRRWCGWWMRQQRGGGPHLNVAWNWRSYGASSGPQVGAVVVWRHHVGQIVGRASNGRWLVQSGNDGGAVRTRARSVKGAIFRI